MTVAGIVITSALDNYNAILVKTFDASCTGEQIQNVLSEIKNNNIEFHAKEIVETLIINGDKHIEMVLENIHYKTPKNIFNAVDDVWVCNIENETSATIIGYDIEDGNITILRV